MIIEIQATCDNRKSTCAQGECQQSGNTVLSQQSTSPRRAVQLQPHATTEYRHRWPKIKHQINLSDDNAFLTKPRTNDYLGLNIGPLPVESFALRHRSTHS